MAIIPNFRSAQRTKCKAAIVIDGLSGLGKTGLALEIAHALEPDWTKIKAVDSENRSMDLYVGRTLSSGAVVESFGVGDLTPDDGFQPTYFSAYRDLALQLGATVFLIDSFSHMWSYKGGVLDMVNEIQSKGGNKYTAWGDPRVAVEKATIMSLVRHPKMHCINTLRVKEKMETTIVDGKSSVISLGDQEITMPDFKYEPDLVLTMVSPGRDDGTPAMCKVTKSRYSPFRDNEVYRMTPGLLEQLRMFLEEGTSPEELDEMRRQDYITAVKKHLDENSNARLIWPALKENNGVANVEIGDISLRTIKNLYSDLIA